MSSIESQPFVGIAHRPDLQPLTEERIHFEIDMCIGCDRCMRVCPVPLSSQVNIADLNRANISDEITSNVARFTEECVMCGSCVPVCPVNNHRDLLMLSLKQKLGVQWDGNVDLNRILQMLPPGWNPAFLVARLREQPMFSDAQLVPEKYLFHLVLSSKLFSVVAGTTIMQEGEYGRSIYFLLEGRLNLSARGINGEELPIAILQRGEYLGEMGMLTGQQRSATAQAQTNSLILEVPEQVMQHLMELVPAIQLFFERLNYARSLESIFKRMALFQGLATADIRFLVEQSQIKRYGRNEVIFHESSNQVIGLERESLYILLDGFVKVARHRSKGEDRIIAYRQSGDYFAGGMDILGDGRPVSVTSITHVNVAEVSRNALLTIFRRYPAIRQNFNQRLQEYRNTVISTQTGTFAAIPRLGVGATEETSTAEARASLHSLVDDGVVEGTEVLVIDLDKCVHCNECEDACTRRHGHSRMNRKGMVVGNISIATACRHCQDPVCMLCSRAGIARMPGGEIYITESCIGCGICAERCPYDNISIINIDEHMKPEPEKTSWQRFNDFLKNGIGKESGRRVLPMATTPVAPGPLNNTGQRTGYDEMRKKIAIKCDLCAGYNNQACVQACPVTAVVRVNPLKFFGSTEDILQS